MPWTNFVKDKFLAPKVSELTECGAKALELGSSHPATWLPNFVLNSILRVSWSEPARQLAFMIVRRADAAVEAYEAGRHELQMFVLKGQGLAVQRYSRALMHFETCLATTYQAWMLFRQLHAEKPRLFERGDRTDFERLNSLYNTSKHADEMIASGRFAPESTLPIWIVNAGLQTTTSLLTFEELAGMLASLARVAGHLSNPPVGE